MKDQKNWIDRFIDEWTSGRLDNWGQMEHRDMEGTLDNRMEG